MDIETKLEQLAEARNAWEQTKDELDWMLDNLKQKPEWIKLAELAESARTQIEILETDLRTATLETYAETGNKKPHPALSVRVNTRLEYDPVLIRQWCIENLPQALTLDKKALEKYAKGVADIAPVPGLTITRQPQATIASDLTAYLVESAADVEIDFGEIEELPF